MEKEGSYPEKGRPTRSRRHLPHLWWGEQELGRWGASSRMELVKKGEMKEGREGGSTGGQGWQQACVLAREPVWGG